MKRVVLCLTLAGSILCSGCKKTESEAEPVPQVNASTSSPAVQVPTEEPAKAVSSMPQAGDVAWTPSVQTDAMTDKKQVRLTARAANNGMTMSIACDGDMANIIMKLPPEDAINYGMVYFKTRIDENQVEDEDNSWCTDEGGTELVLCLGEDNNNYLDYIKKIVGHDRFRIRANSVQRGTIDGDFNISGLAAAMKSTPNSCRWSSIAE